MYFWNYYNKNGPTWTVEYSASFYALQMGFFVYPFGKLLFYLFPKILFQFFTRLVLFVESCFWFGFFFPIASDKIRLIALFAFGCMHVSFGLSLSIGIFALITNCSILILLPKYFWDQFQIQFNLLFISKNIPNLSLHYNPNFFSDKFLAFFFNNFFNFNDIIESTDINSSSNYNESQFGVTNQNTNEFIPYDKAISYLISHSKILKRLSFIPTLLQNVNKLLSKKKMKKTQYNDKFLFESFFKILWFHVIPILCISWTILWCIALNVNFSFYPPFYSVGTALHIDPRWDMFAPDLAKEDNYIILEGTFPDNSKLDLFKNRGIFTWKGSILDFKHPSETYSYDIGSHRWEKFYENLLDHQHKEDLQIRFLEWTCSQWNLNNPTKPVTKITLHIAKRPYAKPFSKEIPNEFSTVYPLRTIQCANNINSQWQT